MQRVKIFYRIIPMFIAGVVIGILFWMLWTNYLLGLIRYFDMDELFYLSLARHEVLGLLPYRDFFFASPPGYLWFLSPLFFFKTGAGALLAARGLAQGVFLSLIAVTSVCYFLTRRSWTVIFVPFFMALLPIPSDKFLEIRPDTLSLALALTGTAFQIYWMQIREKEKVHRLRIPFIIGLFYGLSLFVFPKTAPHILVSLIGLSVFLFIRVRLDKVSMKEVLRLIFTLGLGGGAVGFMFFFWAFFAVGDLRTVWYSITKMTIEMSNLGRLFPIPPDFYFRPNDVFYGTYGYHPGFVMNAILWGVGLAVALIRLITVFFQKKLSGRCTEVLLVASFFFQLWLYIAVYPFKHSQYLIPLAVFVCFYAADGIGMVWDRMKQTVFTRIVFLIITGTVVVICYQGYRMVFLPKFSFSNSETLEEVQIFQHVIPKDTYVLDLTGLTMEYPTPYYVMHLPFGQFARFLSRPLPDLISKLKTYDVQVIYAGGRLNTLLPVDQAYINDKYFPVRNGNIFVRRDALARFDFSSL